MEFRLKYTFGAISKRKYFQVKAIPLEMSVICHF